MLKNGEKPRINNHARLGCLKENRFLKCEMCEMCVALF